MLCLAIENPHPVDPAQARSSLQRVAARLRVLPPAPPERVLTSVLTSCLRHLALVRPSPRPWVLSDYSSDSIDLGSPRSFRPLWRPVGALDDKRLASAHARRRELLAVAAAGPSEVGTSSLAAGSPNEPPYEPLYNTHYSAPAYVAYFLLRAFPELTVHIQSGAFDQSSRTFGAVEATWQNVSKLATGDVKELIPQFYSDPAFLLDDQGVAPCGPVTLPPWAHGSAEEFVRTMRAALESEYASAHLHEWIDLIFGCKQTGDAALAADNLFHPFTYELHAYPHLAPGADPGRRELVLEFASQVGQTPPQLFSAPHPSKRIESIQRVLVREAAAATRIQTSARRSAALRRLASLRREWHMKRAQQVGRCASASRASDASDTQLSQATSQVTLEGIELCANDGSPRDELHYDVSTPPKTPISPRRSRLGERLARARAARHQSDSGGSRDSGSPVKVRRAVGGDPNAGDGASPRLAPLDWGLAISSPKSSTC